VGSVSLLSWILIPTIAAFIGWFTNYIAVKMLFHPREPKRILFITFHGVFPKRQSVLAKKLGELVAEELLSSEEVVEKLRTAARSPEIQDAVANVVIQKLETEIPKQIPMAAMFLGGGALKGLLAQVRPMLNSLVDDLVDLLGQRLQGELNIEQMVEKKVINFSSDKLEQILLGIMKREFRFIELVGGVLGFLIGVMQVILVQLESYLR